jgi:hypothetical protein
LAKNGIFEFAMTFFFTLLFVIIVFWRPQDWLFYLPPQIRILWGVMGLTMMSMLLEISADRIKLFRGPQALLLVGFWLAGIMSHVAHTYFAGMTSAAAELGKLAFFTYVLLCVLDRPSRLRVMAITFVAMALLMTLHAHLQYATGAGFNGVGPIYSPDPDGGLRPRSYFFGIFGDPNDLAQFLAVSIPFVFAIPRKLNIFKFILCSVVSAALVYGVLCTWSRGGMVALGVLAIFPVLLVLPSRWLPGLLAVSALGALAMTPLAGRFLDVSAHERVVFWGLANETFKSNPIFGIGYSMFWQIADDRSAHNAFVLAYTELGMFGFWFWFGLILLGVVGVWRVRILLRDKTGDDHQYVRKYTGLAIAAMSSFCASSFFLSRAYVYPLFFLVAILGAIPAVYNQLEQADPAVQPRPIYNAERDLFVLVSLGTVVSISYIYVAILILNKVWF